MVCLFLSKSNFFENSCLNLFQSDLLCIAQTENHYQVWFGLELWVHVSNFDEVVYFLVQVLIQSQIGCDCIQKFSTEYSISVPINTINGLFEDIEDPPIRYGLILICSESATFSI